ncbi:MAG: HAD family hydrolase [Acidimicrobiales bacterium]
MSVTKESTIEAVLFDFGGVLTTSPFDAVASLGDAAGVPRRRVGELVFGPYHEDTDHAWHRLERGEITVAAWLDDIRPQLEAEGLVLDLEAFAGAFRAVTVNDAVVGKVRSLRQGGYRIALVTNNVAEGSSAWRAMIPVEELFEVVVDSSAVGMRKPDAAIYHHTLGLLGGVAPEKSVFLDDAPGNVEGARRAGLHAILVGPDPAPALAELDALLNSHSRV